MMAPRNQFFDQGGGPIEQVVFLVTDESYLAMPSQRLEQFARLREVAERISRLDFIQPGRATERQQALSEMPPSGERSTAASASSSVLLSRNRSNWIRSVISSRS